MVTFNRFRRIIPRISKRVRFPGENDELLDTLTGYQEAIEELQLTVNSILDNIQPEEEFPRAEELALVRYKNRFKWIMDQIVFRAERDKTSYRFFLTPGHPESERLHRVEIDQLKELGYKIRITIDEDDNYEAIISW